MFLFRKDYITTYGRESRDDWEYTFTSLDPHTTYTVYVYGSVFVGEMKGPVGEKSFRTAEAGECFVVELA